MSQLPDTAYPRCAICGEPIKSGSLLYEITGYERDRSQGGTNHVIARRRTGRVVGTCHAYAVQAGRADQEALL